MIFYFGELNFFHNVIFFCFHLLTIDVEKIKKSHIRFLDSQPNAEPHIDYDGIPFIIMGKKVLECHQGCDRDNKNNRKKRQIKAREDVSVQYF